MRKERLLCTSLTCHTRLVLIALLAVLGFGHTRSQTVTISPKTGNVISVSSYSDEQHLSGYGGAWVHDQLPLTLITSDEATLTSTGLMSVHANNIKADGDGFIWASGDARTATNHMSLSLPQGYRFTGYKIVVTYNKENGCELREMDSSFSKVNRSLTVNTKTKNAVLTRTSLTDTDMGNTLYFHQYLQSGDSYIKVESFVVTFECTDKFDVILRPTDTNLNGGVDCIALPFPTQRVDFGEIKRYTVNDYTSYKYDYKKVKDMAADFFLYDESGIEGGKPSEGHVGKASITSMKNADGLTYYGLKNNTYYVESATEAVTQNGKSVPVGYRIVGARIEYSNTPSTAFKGGDEIFIRDSQGRYLNSSLKYTTTKVKWTYGKDGKVYTDNGSDHVYLRHERPFLQFWKDYELTTTTSSGKATSYTTDGQTLYIPSDNKAYVVGVDGDKGAYTDTYATVVNAKEQAGSEFTITLYDKDGKTELQTVNVDNDNPSGSLVGENFNNDAVKFAVSGLAEGQEAYVCVQLQLEVLNPFIDKLDIVCSQADGSKHLTAQYLADDFTIGSGGKVDFSVPKNFADKTLKFAFDGLNHKKADETYRHCGTKGEYSRYNFVQSEYYNLINENLQGHRSEAADYDYTKKIRVDVAGNKAFRCNNSDKFAAGIEGNETLYFEEYRYSNASYKAAGGSWEEVTAQPDGSSKDYYLIVCDETRYNIAPTTVPRHAMYAYYSTSLRLQTVDYTPELTYTPVYDHAMLATGYDDSHYVGVSVKLTTKDGAAVANGTGYVSAKQLADQIAADIRDNKAGAPASADHILYLDASHLGTVIADDGTSTEWGSMATLQQMLGKNAMIYLPTGVTFNANNIATRSIAGDDFVADNNIVLTDQLPFYAPYSIRVNAANYVSYSRELEPTNKKNPYATLTLPFTVAVHEGVHNNDASGSTASEGVFTVYTMQGNNAFSNERGNNYDYGFSGHFEQLMGVDHTEANTPYLVVINEYAADDAEGRLLFTVRQNGATIEPTPTAITGTVSTGTVFGNSVTMTCRGSFSGERIAKEQGVFYFGNGRFVNSVNLGQNSPEVYMLPFRAWYDCSLPSGYKAMAISLTPNDGTTAIDDAPSAADGEQTVALGTAPGTIMVKALRDVTTTVCSIDGQTVATLQLQAGETRTVSVAAGMYVVGGKKIMVRK